LDLEEWSRWPARAGKSATCSFNAHREPSRNIVGSAALLFFFCARRQHASEIASASKQPLIDNGFTPTAIGRMTGHVRPSDQDQLRRNARLRRSRQVYCADCHDCDQRDRSPRASESACKRSRGFRSGARTCQPVWILSYCGFDPLMGRPFALKSVRPCQPLEIALPTKNRSCSRSRFV
jgi:hypothetical protein